MANQALDQHRRVVLVMPQARRERAEREVPGSVIPSDIGWFPLLLFNAAFTGMGLPGACYCSEPGGRRACSRSKTEALRILEELHPKRRCGGGPGVDTRPDLEDTLLTAANNIGFELVARTP